jgi:hypothetical protein
MEAVHEGGTEGGEAERELERRTVVRRRWRRREREKEREAVRVNEGNGQGRGPGGVKAGRRGHTASSPAHARHAACVTWRDRDIARKRGRGCERERTRVRELERAWAWASEAVLGQKGGTRARERGGAEQAGRLQLVGRMGGEGPER